MPSKPKIGIVCTQLEAGGAQKLAIWQKEILGPEYSVDLFFLYFKSPFMDLDASNCLSKKGSFTSANLIKIIVALRAKLKTAETVLAHTHYSIVLVLLAKLLFRLRVKLIAVHHSEETIYKPLVRRFLASKIAQRRISKNVFVANHIVNGPNSLVIPNPLHSSDPVISSKSITKQIDLLFVGRLSKEKGLDDVLCALALLEGRHLTIIGEGAEREKLETAVDFLNLKNRVSFIGARTPEQVLDHMRRCSKLILASHSEALPMVLLEGISQGCEIICSDIEAHKFAITSGLARSFKAGDPHDLSLKISDDKQVSKSSLNRSKILAQFDEGRLAKKWVDLIKLTLKKPGH